MPAGIAITFPTSPIQGQEYLSQNGFTYVYDSQKNRWDRAGSFVRPPKVLTFAGVAATTTGAGIITGPNGSLIYNIPGTVNPSSDVGIDSYKAYRTTDSYPNYSEIQVSISSAFSSVAYAATSTSTTFSIPASTLSGNTTYYVRARQFVGSNASAASTGAISGYSQNIVQFTTASVFLDTPTIVSIAASTRFPVYQIGFAGTTLPATVTYTGSGVSNLDKVEWRITGPRIPSSTGDTALAEVGIGTHSSATLANSLVLAMPFSGASGVGITSDVNNAIRTASGASAGTTKTVTANGGIGTTSIAGLALTSHFYPSAANFDGSNDYLTFNSSPDFSFGTGDFTIEFWMNTDKISLDTYYRRILSVGGSGDNSTTLQMLFFDGSTESNKVSIRNDVQLLNGTIPVVDNRWHHIALTRSGSTLRLFVDGVLDNSTNNTTNFTDGGSTSSYFGRYGLLSGGHFSGYLQDLKVYKGLAKYTENFTPPLPTYGTLSYTTGTTNTGINTTAFFESTGDTPTAEVAIGSSTAAQVASSLVLAMPMNKTFGFQDINVAIRGLTSGSSAGTAKTVGLGTTSTANAPSQPIISSTESKWYDGAAYFDGGDYVTITPETSTSFSVSSGAFSIECYAYFNNFTGSPVVFSAGTGGVSALVSSSGYLTLYRNGGGGYANSLSVNQLTTGKWYHLAWVTSNGSQWYGYVDGVQGTFSAGWSGEGATSPAYVGTYGNGVGTQTLTGYLQDLKIYKGFAKYTANFTPPQPICGFSTDISTQTGFTTTSAAGALLSSTVGLGTTSTLAFSADQTYAGVTSITSSSGITTLPDPYAQNLVLALPLANITGVGNSFTNDRNTQIRSVSLVGGGTTKTITNSGIGTTTGFLKGYSNTASGFSRASANFVQVADNVDLELGSGNFTIEWWTYLTNTTSQYEGIWSKPGNSDANGLLHHKETDGSLNFNAATGGGSNWNIGASFGSCTLYANRWVHFAAVREGPTIRVYADGILRGTDTDTGTIVDNANPLFIGKYTQFPGGVTLGFDGYLQDFRIYKDTAKYTTNFTPPPPMFGDYTRSTPNKLIFTPASDYVLEARNTSGITTSSYSATRQWGTKPKGGIYDPYAGNLVLAIPGGAVGGATTTFDVTGQIKYETPTATYVNAGIVTYSNSLGIGTYQNKTVTNSGVTVSTAQSKYYGRSLLFEAANNDYLSVTNSADFNFGSGDFTIEFWMYPTTVNSLLKNILWNGNNNGFTSTATFTASISTSNKFSAGIANGSSFTNLSSSTTITANTWYHCAFIRSGSSLRLFLNGIAEASETVTFSANNSTETLKIGVYTTASTDRPYDGYLSDLRIYKGIAKYTSNFTPPNQIYLT